MLLSHSVKIVSISGIVPRRAVSITNLVAGSAVVLCSVSARISSKSVPHWDSVVISSGS